MKVLFVCHGNSGRSQWAEAFFEKMSKKHTCMSAGVGVKKHNREGKIPNLTSIKCMKQLGYDISKKKRKQVTPAMAAKADKIIMITKKSEWPEYIKKKKDIRYWRILDPYGHDYATFCRLRDQLKKRIKALVAEIG